jgi:hypothetical protein
MSPVIDLGWRVYSGQVPGRDFLATFPPSLYLLTALCFRIFGVTWRALRSCCFYGLMLLLGLRHGFLVRKARGTGAAIWTVPAYVAALTIPYILMDVLWHSSLAMNFTVYGSMRRMSWWVRRSSQPAYGVRRWRT